jgi:Domain of unknown function (DUF4249)
LRHKSLLMSLNRFKILVLLFALFQISCEEDFVLIRGTFKPSVVVNSAFTANQQWVVSLTYSRDLLDHKTKIKPITDAYVEIIEKSTTLIIPLQHKGDGIYTTDIHPPKPDKTYELKVSVAGYPLITSSSIAPRNAQVEIISDVVERVDFEIKDVGNNYYIWNLISTNVSNPIDTTYTTDPKNLVESIKKYNNIAGYLSDLTNPNPNDAESQGTKSSLYLPNSNDGSNPGTGQQPDSTVQIKRYLRFLTVSKDLYAYYKTVEKFKASDNHNSSFSQNPEIHSNIKNGLGIFAGYTETYKEIK